MTKGKLDPELLLTAYASGVFPMAENKQDASVFWVEPERRGVLPLDGFHISHSMRRFLKKVSFRLRLTPRLKTSWKRAPIVKKHGLTVKFWKDIADCSSWGSPTASKRAKTVVWSEGYTVFLWAAHFSAKACFQKKPMLPKRHCVLWSPV